MSTDDSKTTLTLQDLTDDYNSMLQYVPKQKVMWAMPGGGWRELRKAF